MTSQVDQNRAASVQVTIACLIAAVILIGYFCAPPTAAAGQISRSAATVTFVAGPSEPNQLTVERSSGQISFRDDGASVTSNAAGCLAFVTTVTCDDSGVALLVFKLGDGDDKLTSNTSLPSLINGDDGDDAIAGGVGFDTVIGGPGNDSLSGGGGNDSLSGSDGHDSLAGDAGDDMIDGGDGNDRVDGGTGQDVVAAGAGMDSIVGGTGADEIDAGSDNDRLDLVDGEADRASCGTGDDEVSADTGDALGADCDRDPEVGRLLSSVSLGSNRLVKSRLLQATIACARTCDATISVKFANIRAVRIGGTFRALPAAIKKRLTVRISKKAHRRLINALNRRKTIKASLLVNVEDVQGVEDSARQKFSVRRRR